ncbi:hypothetical protein BKA62DRAFT_693737 [Auriculariales sp. MPI-PUGE-AT-0066]|nr:hypothetical protein BKA62DRAFT_693737 [Auriculariales sp. MPI-PUGE-AT-0066]
MPGLQSNEAAKTIICNVCKQTFVSLVLPDRNQWSRENSMWLQLSTTRKPALEEHASNKHSAKTFADCFPNVS